MPASARTAVEIGEILQKRIKLEGKVFVAHWDQCESTDWWIGKKLSNGGHGHHLKTNSLGSIDCVRLINEEHIVTGADDGSLALWTVGKKKPVTQVKCAHGSHGDAGLEQPYWLTSIAAALNSDVVASGSHDGFVHVWRCGEGFRSLSPLFTVPVVGFVNSLQFSSSANFLVAGIGQEHRLGRWWRKKEAKNALCIIPFKRTLVLGD